jgi:NADH-quinone oxidoreductase subunit N
VDRADLLALLPFLLLGGSAILVMLGIAWRRHHGGSALLGAAGLALTLASLPVAAREAPRPVTRLLLIDGFALYFMGLVCVASLVVVVLAHGYFRDRGGQREELYVLVLLATLGSAVLAASVHFASLFLGLELLSISLYALVAYPRASEPALEAGLKYLILAAASSAFLLFGMALVYARTGGLDFPALRAGLPGGPALASGSGPGGEGVLVAAALGLLFAGIGFKLALVPFHAWTPDVYAGAPAPVTAFVASVSKGGVVAVTLRLFDQAGEGIDALFVPLAAVAIASMLAGNLLALQQDDVKRLLAYSSIAHFGYLLVALIAAVPLRAEATAYYLAAYVVTILIAFGVVAVLSTGDADASALDDYRGLFWRRPWLAVLFTASLLSLAGIPLTAGFLGKVYVLLAGVEAASWLLVLALVAGSAIGLFPYLRVVLVLFAPLDQPGDRPAARGAALANGSAAPALRPLPALSVAVLSLLAVPLLWLGVHPEPLMRLIQALF